MKHLYILISFILTYSDIISSQVIGINGGNYPNGLKGTHFGSRFELPLFKKINISLNYQLVKYTDIFAEPSRNLILHKEYKNDLPLILYKEFERGIPIKVMDIDFRPKILNHSYSILFGYQIFTNSSLSSSIKIGPHISFGRYYNHSFSVNPATIQFTQGSDQIVFQYYDYEIFRSWDLGPTGRIDIEYKIFENISIGLMSIMYMDIIDEGVDLCGGISLSFNFSESKYGK
jgi:hypothetical protein